MKDFNISIAIDKFATGTVYTANCECGWSAKVSNGSIYEVEEWGNTHYLSHAKEIKAQQLEKVYADSAKVIEAHENKDPNWHVIAEEFQKFYNEVVAQHGTKAIVEYSQAKVAEKEQKVGA